MPGPGSRTGARSAGRLLGRSLLGGALAAVALEAVTWRRWPWPVPWPSRPWPWWPSPSSPWPWSWPVAFFAVGLLRWSVALLLAVALVTAALVASVPAVAFLAGVLAAVAFFAGALEAGAFFAVAALGRRCLPGRRLLGRCFSSPSLPRSSWPAPAGSPPGPRGQSGWRGPQVRPRPCVRRRTSWPPSPPAPPSSAPGRRGTVAAVDRRRRLLDLGLDGLVRRLPGHPLEARQRQLDPPPRGVERLQDERAPLPLRQHLPRRARRRVAHGRQRDVAAGLAHQHERAVRGEALDLALDGGARLVVGDELDERQRLVDRRHRRPSAVAATRCGTTGVRIGGRRAGAAAGLLALAAPTAALALAPATAPAVGTGVGDHVGAGHRLFRRLLDGRLQRRTGTGLRRVAALGVLVLRRPGRRRLRHRHRRRRLLRPDPGLAPLRLLDRLPATSAPAPASGARRPSRRPAPACRRSSRPSSNSHAYSPWNSWNESFDSTTASALSAIRSTNASPRPMAPAGGVDELVVGGRLLERRPLLVGDAVAERGVDDDGDLGVRVLVAEGPHRLVELARLGRERPSVAMLEPSTTTRWDDIADQSTIRFLRAR